MAITSVREPSVGGPPPPVRRSAWGITARRRLAGYGLAAPGTAWLLLFFLIPAVMMVYTSLESGGVMTGYRFNWAWGTYPEALAGRAVFFGRSLEYALLTALGTMVLAFPAVYWIAFYGGRRKSTLLFMILLPYFVSFMIRTVMWKFILGDNGPLLATLKGWHVLSADFRVLATPFAVVMGLIYNYLPFSALPLYVALERIDPALIEAAKDLFANRTQAFLRVVLPLSLPGVFAATLLTFVPATGDYVEAEILGSPSTRMIGNIIQNDFLVNADYPKAAALSLVLMLGMVILTSIYARFLGTEDEVVAAAVTA